MAEIRLLGDDGTQYGVMTIEEAKRISLEHGLDLVEVSPTAKPPVVKLIDFGKFKYQQQKKAAEAKKKQTVIQLKEIKLRQNIEKHDLDTKLKNIYKFLDNGDKVKLLMQFRGREMAHKDLGIQKFKAIIKQIVDAKSAVVEDEPKLMGNRVIALVSPFKKKG